MKIKKRKIDILVLSDIHLGTFGSHAEELVQYLGTIKPGMVILNGDIIDGWQFSRRYFPKAHIKVIRQILEWLTKGVKVYYITGNHDEVLRRFRGFRLGNLKIVNKLKIHREGSTYWFFHGDVFDVTMQYSKWLARLGSVGYNLLILLNSVVNSILKLAGRGKISFSKRVKNGVKEAVKFINNFENTVAGIAAEKGYDYVVCGHIHKPEIRKITTNNREVVYMNSGDWIESLSSLEYANGIWRLYYYEEDVVARALNQKSLLKNEKKTKQLFSEMLTEFQILNVS